MRKILMSGFALAALGLASIDTATAQPMHFDQTVGGLARAQSAVTDVQYRRYGGYRRDRGYNGGAAIGAGIAGLAAGAIIGGAIANSQQRTYYEGGPAPVVDDEVSYCMQQFRSYDPRSGPYMGYDGMRHACP